MELSDRVVTFLGKLDTDPEFQEFLTEFKPYLSIQSLKNLKIYSFAKLGFTIDYFERVGFTNVSFHIYTRAVTDGDFKPFSELLPFGISISDTRAEVQRKLGVEPIRATPYEGYPDRKKNCCERHETWWDTYAEPMHIGVIFRSPVGDMDLFAVHRQLTENDFASMKAGMGAKQIDDPTLLIHQNSSGRRRLATRKHRQHKKPGD